MKNNLYLVQSSSGRTLHIWAASKDQAKRIFCKEYGFLPSDSWCGVSNLTARKLKPEEVKAWEAGVQATRDTAIFLQGMMGICASRYKESNTMP